MRPGTPGFVGERLRSLREARGINTAAGLAEMLNISRASVSQYERGEQSPSPAILKSASEVLNVPLHYFTRGVTPRAGAVFYRSLSAATKSARTRAERRLQWLQEIVDVLRGYIKFPENRFPTISLPADLNQISFEMIEAAADSLRRHWGLGLGPISNVAWLLENMGVIVVRLPLDADTLDAFSQWPEGAPAPFIVLGADKESAVRSRFDAAHELGHLVLHRHLDPSILRRPEMFRLIEQQAHRFAGAFLLPQKTFTAEMSGLSLDSLLQLKLRWKVSVQVMVKRIENLEIVSNDDARRLWLNVGRRQWRKREPFDDQIEVEEPRLLQKCVTALIDAQIVSKSELPALLALSARDIEVLLNLPQDFLCESVADPAQSEPETVILKFPGQSGRRN